MTYLPPQWVESAHEAREDIKSIREKLKELAKVQTKRMKKVFADDSPDKEVENISSQVTALCRHCEQAIHQIKARGSTGSASDYESRLNVQRGLATSLQHCTQEFRGMQKQYMEKIKERQRGSAWDEGPSTSSYGGALGSSSGGGGSFISDSGFSNSQLYELEAMETNAGQRSVEINQIATSINDLHTIFKELAVLVIDQGSILDRIDYNIEQVVDQSREANVQLQRAEKSQKSNRALKCIIILVIINVVLILILIVKARR
jgi:syntaxin 16